MKCVVALCCQKAIYGKKYKSPLRCKMHRMHTDINCTQRRCLKCNNLASYGWPFDRAIVCSTHKYTGMSKIRNPQCMRCYSPAYFTDAINDEPVFCGKHIVRGSINCVFSKCNACNIFMTFQHLEDGLCENCKKIPDPSSEQQPHYFNMLQYDCNIKYNYEFGSAIDDHIYNDVPLPQPTALSPDSRLMTTPFIFANGVLLKSNNFTDSTD